MFHIGDKVKIKTFDNMPDGFKSRAMGKLCESEAVIVDKLASEDIGKTVYFLKLDGKDTVSYVPFAEDCFEKIDAKGVYEFEVNVLDNIVIVRLLKDGEEVKKNHGHIIHDGDLGVIQAASYALKSMLCRMDDQGVYRKIGGSL